MFLNAIIGSFIHTLFLYHGNQLYQGFLPSLAILDLYKWMPADLYYKMLIFPQTTLSFVGGEWWLSEQSEVSEMLATSPPLPPRFNESTF